MRIYEDADTRVMSPNWNDDEFPQGATRCWRCRQDQSTEDHHQHLPIWVDLGSALDLEATFGRNSVRTEFRRFSAEFGVHRIQEALRIRDGELSGRSCSNTCPFG